jgi:hypothetical protein
LLKRIDHDVPELPALLLPEVLGILGVDDFLLLSILTCLFDFPTFIQYIYHISAFVGFGELWVNFAFNFSEEIRFFACLGYLVIGLANVIFVNWYVHASNRKIMWTTTFLAVITIPSVFLGFLAASYYVNKIMISLPWLPLIPYEFIPSILVACVVILIAGIAVSKFILKPKVSNRRGGAKRI